MELVKKSISTWINAAIILTIGILVIVMGAARVDQGGADAAEAISVVLGIALIVVSSLALVLSIVGGILSKLGFAAAGVSAGVSLALGISLVVGKYAAGLISLFIYVIPFALVVVGAVILADAIYMLVMAILGKASPIAHIISIVVGVAALVLGILCIGNDPVIPFNAQLIVFGIVVCIAALIMVLGTFFKLPTAVATVVVKEETTEKAE